MMNYIWVAFVVIAVIAGGVTGNIEAEQCLRLCTDCC